MVSDQALATLFCRSSWTQEQLAKKEGVSKSQVDRSLRFGRFLNFPPNGGNPENTLHALTEGKFRTYWDRTDKAENNERIRFKAVQEQVVSEPPRTTTTRWPRLCRRKPPMRV